MIKATWANYIFHMVLNHKWRPSIKVRGKARGIETVMFVNGQSWVGQNDVNKKKPKNTYRIFYVGDSNISGVVPWGKQMASLVEKKLNQSYASTGIRIVVPPFMKAAKQKYLMTPEGILKLSRFDSWNKKLSDNLAFYRLASKLLTILMPDKKSAVNTKGWQAPDC